jgi:dTDP-4-dehydrorhamnose 3,5-epimerase
MKVETTPIKDLLVITPKVFEDDRGYFLESFNSRAFRDAGLYYNFVQDNQSVSLKNVIRGLHFQKSVPQAKLVRVIAGSIWDVAVDLRRNSRTFGQWFGVELNEDNFKQLLVPRGFAHGFSVLSDVAVVSYKCDELYMATADAGIVYSDPTLKVDWKITEKPIVSEKDGLLPKFDDIQKEINF